MKQRLRIPLLAVPMLVLGSMPLLATTPPASPATFDTFASLDQQLTILDQQLQKAKTTLVKGDNTRPTSRQGARPWVEAARKMQPTVAAILRASSRLEQIYGHREVRLHRPLFRRLYRRARALRANVRLLSEARTRRWARVVQTRLSKAIVAYVFDFQIVSGGYVALRCQPDQLACCEPARKEPHGPFSCKWTCSQGASSCRDGFLGPQIGTSYERPLSASR